MQLFQANSAFRRNLRIMGSTGILIFGFLSSQIGLSEPVPQGGGTIVLEEGLLRAISDSPEDPVIRIEVWRDGSLLHGASACGAQTCHTDISHLSSGAILAIGFTQASTQFSEEMVLE